MLNEQASLGGLASIIASISLFAVSVILILCAAIPGPSPGWAVTTSFSEYFATDYAKIAFGIISGIGLMICLATGRPLYLCFFAPALMMAVLPLERITLDTSYLRYKSAFDREVESRRLPVSLDDARQVNQSPELQAFILSQPELAFQNVGWISPLRTLVGIQGYEAAQYDWFSRGKEDARTKLAAQKKPRPDYSAAVNKRDAARNALIAEQGRKITRCLPYRRGFNVDGPPYCPVSPADTRDEQAALAAAEAELGRAVANAEAFDAAAEAELTSSVASTIATVNSLTSTVSSTRETVIDWSCTLVISVVTLVLLFFFGILGNSPARFAAISGVIAVTVFIVATALLGDLPLPSAAPSIMSLATGTFVLLSGISVGRLWFDNRTLINSISPLRRRQVLLVALRRWCPLFICLLIGMGFAAFFSSWLSRAAYDVKIDRPVAYASPSSGICSNPHKAVLIPLQPSAKDLEADIDNSIECHLANARNVAQKLNSNTSNAMVDLADEAGALALSAVDRLLPRSLPCDADGEDRRSSCVSEAFNYPECKWFDLICKAKRIPHRASEKAYLDVRLDTVEWVAGRIEKLKQDLGAKAPLAQASVDNLVVFALSQAAAQVRLRLWQGFRVWEILNAVAFLLSVVAVCKSAGYVCARVFYSQRPTQRKKGVQSQDLPKVSISETQVHELKTPGLHYVLMGVDTGGVAPKGPWPPQISKMFFARFPLKMLFNYIRLESKSDVAEFGTKNAGRFIEVTLTEGQAISFYANNLYSFSATIKFSTRWSFRMPNLLRGRISSSTATGPGVIVFASPGPVRLLTAESEGQGHSPTALIAWSPDLDIIATKKASMSDIYFGGIVIKPQAGSFAIFDLSARRSYFPGAVKFIPLLLSPV